MVELEQSILKSALLKPLVWWRYIDDIFMIWQHGEENLNAFLHALKPYLGWAFLCTLKGCGGGGKNYPPTLTFEPKELQC